MSRQLNETFNSILDEINKVICSKAQDKFNQFSKEIENKITDKSLIRKQTTLIKTIETLGKKRDRAEEELAQVKREIERDNKKQLLYKYNSTIKDVANNLHVCSYGDVTLAKAKAAEQVSKTKEYANLKLIQDLTKQVRDIYNIACSAKEKRSVILKLQNTNWKELGIDLSPVNFMNPDFKIKIKDGKLITNVDRLLTASNK